MMNLKNLHAQTQRLRKIKPIPDKNNRSSYHLGLLCLEFARQGEYQDRELCQRACQFFFAALSKDPDHLPSYLALAWTLVVYQDPDQAQRYIDEILKRNPRHMEARELQRYCEYQRVRVQAGTLPKISKTTPLSEADLPELSLLKPRNLAGDDTAEKDVVDFSSIQAQIRDLNGSIAQNLRRLLSTPDPAHDELDTFQEMESSYQKILADLDCIPESQQKSIATRLKVIGKSLDKVKANPAYQLS